MKRLLIGIFATLVASGTCQAELALHDGRNDIKVPKSNKEPSVEYTLYGSGKKKITMRSSSSQNVQMYLQFDESPIAKEYTLIDCSPKNTSGKAEVCYVNLDQSSASRPFRLVLKNQYSVSSDRYAMVTVENYTCTPSISSTQMVLCPPTSTIEKSDSATRSWRKVHSNLIRTHIHADKYAKDVNWNSKNQDEDQPLFAAMSGTVLFAGNVNGYGKQVILYHQYTKTAIRYAHLNEIANNVSVGDKVRTGEYIGKLGGTGNAFYTHLHMVAYKNIDDKAKEYLSDGGMPYNGFLDDDRGDAFAFPFTFTSQFDLKASTE